MSEQPATLPGIPEWDLADRMRKALRHADVSVQQMSVYLGVSRRSVGNWINGHIDPSTQTLRLWALRTGVPLEWLRTGQTPQARAASEVNPWSRRTLLRPTTSLLTAVAA